jgi:hypothetical protein
LKRRIRLMLFPVGVRICMAKGRCRCRWYCSARDTCFTLAGYSDR